jgi:hypothetical protein
MPLARQILVLAKHLELSKGAMLARRYCSCLDQVD